MKTLKKALSLCLAVVIAVGCMSLPAMAEGDFELAILNVQNI